MTPDDGMTSPRSSWTHQICERCWFLRPDNFKVGADGDVLYRRPVQMKSPDDDLGCCCFCGTACVTGIFIRLSPNSQDLRFCHGVHPEGAVNEPTLTN